MNSKPLVIVVEDDHDLGDAISDILELAQDVQIELIEDGLKAKERFQTVIPKLILLDIHLPKVSGIELLHRFIVPWHASGTKVIAMTADLLLIPKIEGIVDCCLSKPFSFEKLTNTVSQMLVTPPPSMPD